MYLIKTLQKVIDSLNITRQFSAEKSSLVAQESLSVKEKLNKLKGIVFVVIGYLLSPLCWWNDLIFNLPIAYGFGYICSLVAPKLLVPGAIAGYWLSNIVGILLMQAGTLDIVQQQPKERNLKKELLTGLVSSTVYTIIILGLIQLKVLDSPIL